MELIAGKNRANGVAALLKNYKQIDNVLATIDNSSGSAMRENEKRMDSLSVKVDLFKNRLEQMWNTTLNSEVLKWFTDLGTKALEAVNAVGGLVPVLGALAGTFAIKKFKTPLNEMFGTGQQGSNAFARFSNGVSDFLFGAGKAPVKLSNDEIGNLISEYKKFDGTADQFIAAHKGMSNATKSFFTSVDKEGATLDAYNQHFATCTNEMNAFQKAHMAYVNTVTSRQDYRNAFASAREEIQGIRVDLATLSGAKLPTEQVTQFKNAISGLTQSDGLKLLREAGLGDRAIFQVTGLQEFNRNVDDLTEKLRNLRLFQNGDFYQTIGGSFTAENETAIRGVIDSFNDLTVSEQQLAMQALGFNEVQQQQILGIKGLSAEEQLLKLSEMELSEQQIANIMGEEGLAEARLATARATQQSAEATREAAATTSTSGLQKLTGFFTGLGDKINGVVSYLGSMVKSMGVLGTAMTAFMAFTVIKQVFDSFTTSAEELEEKVNSLVSKFQNAKDKVEEHKSTISSVSDRYVELSKGVNDYGKNISLTSEEFSEYQSICNQIADMYPSLVQGYDAQGNAILRLKGNVDALNESLAQEEKAAYYKMIEGSSDVIDKWNRNSKTAWNDKIVDFGSPDVGGQISKTLATQVIEKIATGGYEEFKKETNNANSIFNDSTVKSYIQGTLGLSFDATQAEYDKVLPELLAKQQEYKQDMETDLYNIQQEVDAYTHVNDRYKDLNDSQKDVLDMLIKNMNYDDANKAAENMTYFADELINQVNNVGLMSSYEKLTKIKMDEGSLVNNQKMVDDIFDSIQNSLNLSDDEKYQLKVKLGFEPDIDDNSISNKELINTVTNKLQEQLGNINVADYIGKLDKTHLESLNNVDISNAKTLEDVDYMLSKYMMVSEEVDDLTKKENELKVAELDLKHARESGVENLDSYKQKVSELKSEYAELKEEEAKNEFTSFLTAATDADALNVRIKETMSNVSSLSEIARKYENGTLSGDDLLSTILDHPELAYETDNLAYAIEDINEAAKSEMIAKLNDEIKKFQEQGKDTTGLVTLRDAIKGVSSAYDEWQQAQQTENAGSMYDTIAQGFESSRELYKQGLVGTDDFTSFAKLIDKNGSTDADTYNKNYKKLSDYFNTEDASGIKLFLNDLSKLKSETGEYFAVLDKNGGWKINVDDFSDAAEKMGMSSDLFGAAMQKLNDYGFETNYIASVEEGTSRIADDYKQIAEIEQKRAELKQKLKDNKITKEEYKVEIDTLDADNKIKELKNDAEQTSNSLNKLSKTDAFDYDAEVKSAKELVNQYQKQIDAINKGADGYDKLENKQEIIKKLADEMQKLNEEYHLELTIDSSGLEKNVDTVKTKSKEASDAVDESNKTSAAGFHQIEDNAVKAQEETEKQKQATEEATQASENLGATATENLQKVTDSANQTKTSVNEIGTTVDQVATKKVGDLGFNTLGSSINSAATRFHSFISELNSNLNKSMNVKVNYQNLKVKAPSSTNTVAVRSGGAQANGGDIKRTGNALTGEEGREIVVNRRTGTWRTVGDNGAEFTKLEKGDIVFNADQTEELLSNGSINSRGTAFINGTISDKLFGDAYAGKSTGTASGKFQGGARKVKPAKHTNKNADDDDDKKSKKKSTGKDKDTKKKNKDTKKDTSDFFDFVEIRINKLKDNTSKAMDKISESLSFDTIVKRAKNAIKDINKEIDGNRKASKIYEKKANKVKLSESLKSKVRNGGLSSGDIKKLSESKQDAVSEYQNWYEKQKACLDTIDQYNEQLKQVSQNTLSAIQNSYSNKRSTNENSTNLIQARIDSREARGKVGTTNQYNTMARNASADMLSYENEANSLTSELNSLMKSGVVKKNTEEWYAWQEAINEARVNAENSRKSMIEYSDALYNVPLDEASNKIEKFTANIEALEDTLATYSSASTTNNFYRIKTNDAKNEYNKAKSEQNSMRNAYNVSKREQSVAKKSYDKAKKAETKADKDESKAAKKLTSTKGLTKDQKSYIKKKTKSGEKVSTKGLKGKALKNAKAYNKTVDKKNKAKLNKNKAKTNYNNSKSKTASARKTYDTAKKNYATAKNNYNNARKTQQNYANTDTYVLQNRVLDNELKEMQNTYNENKNALKIANSNLNKAKNNKFKSDSAFAKQQKSLKNNKKLSASQRKAVSEGKYINTTGLSGKALKDAKAYNKALKDKTLNTERYTSALKSQEKASKAAASSQKELAQKMTDTANAQLENIQNFYDAKGGYLSSTTSTYDSYMDLKNSRGSAITENDYITQIKNKQNERANYVAEKQKLHAELSKKVKEGSIKYGSEDWMKWEEQLDSLTQSINQCDVAVNEYTDSIRDLKLENYAYKVERNQADTNAINSAIKLMETKGISPSESMYKDMIANSNENISYYQEQIKIQQEAMKGWNKNSEKYKNAQKEVDSLTQSIADEKQSIEELNQTILNMPFDKAQKLQDNLQSISDRLQSTISLMEKYGQDITKDMYEGQISAINDVIKSQEDTLALQEEYLANAKANADGVYDGKSVQEWETEINNTKQQINNTKMSVEELKDTMREKIYYSVFDEAIEKAQRLETTLNNLSSLIDDSMLYDKDTGKLTDFGMVKLSTSVDSYKNNLEQIRVYKNKIAEINRQYNNGDNDGYNYDEYIDDLTKAQQALQGVVADTKSSEREIIGIIQGQYRAELDALEKVIDKRSEALQKKKE